ncbi:MAG TPA: hypothetical protein VMU82_12800 [Acetobacteraceae bacterium]|nr:hypothetical protein [Acetobacteraceae bacterium]
MSTFAQTDASRTAFSAPAPIVFIIEAITEPGLLPRLIQPFARRDVLPDRFEAHRHGDTLHVVIGMAGAPEETIALIEGNLCQIVGVHALRRIAGTPQEMAA